MASGRFDLSDNQTWQWAWVEYQESNINVTNNTSDLTVWVYFRRSNNGYTSHGTMDTSCTVNGSTQTESVKFSNNGSSDTLVFSKVFSGISHDDDGSKTISISVSVSGNNGFSGSGSTYISLDTIPRKSTATTSYLEASSGANAGTVSVNISRASSSFLHAVTLDCNGFTATNYNVETFTSFDIPLTWLHNKSSNGYSVTVATYSGNGTHIGSNPYSGTATVRSSLMPSIDFSITRVQGDVPSDWGDVYVKNKSKYTLSITGTAGQGSSIKGYTIDGKWYSTNASDYNYTSDFITKSGNVAITVWIEDERSRATKKEITISVLDYFTPAFKNVLSQRTDATGVQVGNGNYFKSVYDVNFASCDGHNEYAVTIDYLMHGENQQYVSVDDLSAVAYGNNNILPDHSYTIRYGVTDTFTTIPVYYYDDVSTEAYTMFFKKGGRAVSFGKACEKDNLLETEWDFKFNKRLLQKDGTEVPYVVEQGTKDGWIYRKWNSGIAECFKESRVTTPASQYGDNVALMIDYLPFEINSAIANVSGGQFQTWGSVIRMVHTNGVYIQVFMDCVNPVSSNFCWFYISITGRWK